MTPESRPGSGEKTLTNATAGGHITVADTVINNYGVAPTPPRPNSALHQLPEPPPHFTGRDDELARLLASLESGQTTGATIAGKHTGLHGMGGVGKTALALTVADRLKHRFPAAQLYYNLRGADPDHRDPLRPAEVMERILHAFQPEAKLPEDAETLRGLYLGTLRQAGPVLLLLDNAAGADQIKPLLPPANCLLLITSRTQFSLPGLALQSLDCLTPEKARELLCALSPRLGQFTAEVTESAELCGRLPLALEFFAGVVQERTIWSVPDLVARLRAKNKDTLEPVRAAFQISYDLLAPSAQKDWRTLAVFPGSFEEAAAAAVWQGAELESARHRLQALVKASLVEYNPGNARFRLHDLVREYLAGLLDPEERRETRIRFGGHFARVGDEVDQLYLKGGQEILRGLAVFDLERANLEAARALLSEEAGLPLRDGQRKVQPIADASARESARLLIQLVNGIVYVGALRFHPRERMAWLQAQLAASQIAGDRAAEGRALGNLGLAYAALGEVRKAIEHHEAALLISREIGDRRGEGSTLGNLGTAYAALGEAQRAIEHYEAALRIRREIGDRSGEANDCSNLALACFHLDERERAISLAREALAIYEAIESPNADKARKVLAEWSAGTVK